MDWTDTPAPNHLTHHGEPLTLDDLERAMVAIERAGRRQPECFFVIHPTALERINLLNARRRHWYWRAWWRAWWRVRYLVPNLRARLAGLLRVH